MLQRTTENWNNHSGNSHMWKEIDNLLRDVYSTPKFTQYLLTYNSAYIYFDATKCHLPSEGRAF